MYILKTNFLGILLVLCMIVYAPIFSILVVIAMILATKVSNSKNKNKYDKYIK